MSERKSFATILSFLNFCLSLQSAFSVAKKKLNVCSNRIHHRHSLMLFHHLHKSSPISDEALFSGTLASLPPLCLAGSSLELKGDLGGVAVPEPCFIFVHFSKFGGRIRVDLVVFSYLKCLFQT